MARTPVSAIVDGKRVIVKKPELLAPAGSLEKLKIAVMYGADAVFIGGREFGLRSNAQNFSLEEIKEGVEFANQYGSKIYITTNIIAHNENMVGLEDYLTALGEIGVAGIIVADPLIIETCKRVAPNVEVHLSTQQSTMNYMAIKFWEQEGLHRVVLARETTKEEIKEIMDKTDVEIEALDVYKRQVLKRLLTRRFGLLFQLKCLKKVLKKQSKWEQWRYLVKNMVKRYALSKQETIALSFVVDVMFQTPLKLVYLKSFQNQELELELDVLKR